MLIHGKHIFAIPAFKHTAIHPQPAIRLLIDSAKAKIFLIELQCLYQLASETIGRLVNRFINPGEEIKPVIQAYVLLLNIYAFRTWWITSSMFTVTCWMQIGVTVTLYIRGYILDPEYLSALYFNIAFILPGQVKQLLDSCLYQVMSKTNTWRNQLSVLARYRTCLHAYLKWQPLWVYTRCSLYLNAITSFLQTYLLLNGRLNNSCYILI